ncbi:MAG: type II secretion system protein [Puniceicoccaceae bacterium]
MKTRQYRSKQAFTLIELLTVIAIIGILAGIIIPTVGAVRENAMKSKTKAMFSQWVSAMDLFRQDYGYYPSPDDLGFPGVSVDDEFYLLLTGDEDSELNKKERRYFSFSEDSIAGASHDSADEGDIIDAFGNNNISMAVDSDLNGIIEDEELNGAPTEAGQDSIRSSVIFWTIPDGDYVEVKSW